MGGRPPGVPFRGDSALFLGDIAVTICIELAEEV